MTLQTSEGVSTLFDEPPLSERESSTETPTKADSVRCAMDCSRCSIAVLMGSVFKARAYPKQSVAHRLEQEATRTFVDTVTASRMIGGSTNARLQIVQEARKRFEGCHHEHAPAFNQKVIQLLEVSAVRKITADAFENA